MNTIATMNESTFNYLKQTFVFQFKHIHFTKNTITFNGESILLKDFELETILNHNSYVLNDLTEKEIFDILKVHSDIHNKLILPTIDIPKKGEKLQSIVISGENTSKDDETDLINMDRFITLTRKTDDFSENDKKEIDRFFELYKRMVLYEDYLTPEAQIVLKKIKQLLKNLEVEVLEL